ncbi:MAG: hypothetical protein ABI599_05430 [Flavobacteriales bacterium]
MKTKSILLLSTLVLAIGGGSYAYKEYNRGVEDASREDAAAALSAEQLVNEFKADEAASNTKYTGKIVEVVGVVKSVDGSTLVLSAGAEDAEVSCSFESTPMVRTANKVTVKGECAGFDALIGAQVQLVRCAIVE